MVRLIAETVVHAVLVPGTVVVAMPWLIRASGFELHSFDSGLLRGLGGLSLVAGVLLGLWCTRHFLVSGEGTPNPLDPPKLLVRAGPYRIVRNPMYVSVALILGGEALVFGSTTLVVYLLATMCVVHLVVVRSEEPALRRLFGPAYDDYSGRVPRWIPRTRAR